MNAIRANRVMQVSTMLKLIIKKNIKINFQIVPKALPRSFSAQATVETKVNV